MFIYEKRDYRSMAKINAVIMGQEEERDPLQPCPMCGQLPQLVIMRDSNAIKIFFCCEDPKCAFYSMPACTIRNAEKNWNAGRAPDKQSRVDDY